MRPHRTKLAAALVALLIATGTMIGNAGPAAAYTPVAYDGFPWMSRVGIVGDSLVFTTTPEIKSAVRSDWWRDATFSFPGVQTHTMRDQIRGMASGAPEAFVLSLGNMDTAALKAGSYDWNFERAQIHGVLDDLTRARVGCVVWVGPNENFDGGALDHWARRINTEIKSELARRGIGVYGDWTARAAGRPHYFLADGSHFTAAGKAAFSGLIVDRLRDCNRNPGGHLDSVRGSMGSLRVTGWAHDPDTANPIDVHLYVNNQFKGSHRAGLHRPDVGRANPLIGSNRGFDVNIPMTGGQHTACVYGINVGPYGYKHTLLGCRSAVVPDSPIGSFDSATGGNGTIRADGWAIDPDTPNPIGVHLYVNGQYAGAGNANLSRPDVGAAFPGYGNNHGFSLTVGGFTRGNHQACVWGINAPGTPGGNRLLGCRNVFVPQGASPIGSLDTVSSPAPSTVRITGWAIDPDTPAPIDVHVYVDWSFAGVFSANTSRPDVGAAFPGYGNNHGFAMNIGSIPPGGRDVCVFAINAAGTAGGNTFLGCRRVTVAS